MMRRGPAHILLVEDNAMDLELTLHAFRDAGSSHTIHTASTGEETLDYLLGRSPWNDRTLYPMPDLILLDLKLPGMGGHNVLHRIKSTPGLKRIPVIVLTSSREESDVRKSYDNGANSYLLKPASFGGLMDIVNAIDKYWLTMNISPSESNR